MSSWKDNLHSKLVERYGSKKGLLLDQKYKQAFSHSYCDDYSLDVAIDDIHYMEMLSPDNRIVINLYAVPGSEEGVFHLRLFQIGCAISLSDILPMLENMDLRTESERPHKIALANSIIWISDFTVTYSRTAFAIDKVKQLFQEAFKHVYFGICENDGFNKLVLGASLSSREIIILRAYAKYLRQVGFRFSQTYIEKTLISQTAITRDLIEFFKLRHNPETIAKTKKQIAKTEERILSALETVSSLDEDRIIRRILDLMKSTLRTNYFQFSAENKPKSYLSIKLNSRAIPELPLPMPLYEVFVYSPRFEAIHLRNTKVARGGLRWSDRPEDFRIEVLGLMKAQVVKNAIIVPSGAKGGFVVKTESSTNRQQNGIECYQSFISGLLDITDNIVDNRIVQPADVVCYDDNDPYLVVAADKGTATFSDIANDISNKYHFWLGDAFASGGSAGYDHKKIGITARGAWESIKRHFCELNVDIATAEISVIGIGDMSGDVFGNGLLYSNHIKLVAAFDHRHIFLDPSPDPKTSYAERRRLFNLPISSWENYNSKLISKGGGIFKRSLKSISLSPQIKKILAIEENELAPTELIRAILKAPVDLFFNGGIGTYVKASSENQTEVGDRTNDYCRINGNELRCKVVGEGGNLGFTQLGRVEYALTGGLINTDFIDNSAGVDCSDHEVNLKILLDKEVQHGKLSQKKRDDFLASLTEEVAELVLKDNYYQALVMSIAAESSNRQIGLQIAYLKELETIGILNRQVEFLPDEKQLIERKAAGIGLTRPELAVVLAYTKIHIKHEILKSNLPEDAYLSQFLAMAFPSSVRQKYQSAMNDHRLKRDIIATQLSNFVVNSMGITFVYRLQMETGANVDEIIRAYIVSSKIFAIEELQKLVQSLDFKIPMVEQYNMLFNLRALINLSARWFLHDNHLKDSMQDVITHYAPRINTLGKIIPDLMTGQTRQYLENLTTNFLNIGLPKEVAKRIAGYRAIYAALNVVYVATTNKFDLIQTAKLYFLGGERMNLVWFRDHISKDTSGGHWNTVARLTIRDELDISQRALTVAIMKHAKKNAEPQATIDAWFGSNQRALERWDRLLAMLHGSTNIDYTMFFIAIRELIGLILASQ